MTDDDTDRYRHYVAAGHVEGKAAIQIRLAGSTGGTMHHNNPNGTCPYCLHQVPTLLPEGATLTVIPPPAPPHAIVPGRAARGAEHRGRCEPNA